MASRLPPVPEALAPLKKFLTTADQFDGRSPCIAYYCRFYAVTVGMNKFKSKPNLPYLLQIMDVVENDNKLHKNNGTPGFVGDRATAEASAQDIISSTALKLFNTADKKDRDGNADKNLAAMFKTVDILFEVLASFDVLCEDHTKLKKYAKWKAVYIGKCIKDGIVPLPGPQDANGNPLEIADGDGGEEDFSSMFRSGSAQGGSNPSSVRTSSNGPAVPAASSLSHPSNPYPSTTHAPPPVYSPVPAQPAQPAQLRPPAMIGGFSTVAKKEVSVKDMDDAKKFCKFAISSLDYADNQTAVDNLLKALNLLTK